MSFAIKTFKTFGDIGQAAIPIGIGLYALCSDKKAKAVALAAIGLIQHLEVAAIKKAFPRARPESYIPGRNSPEDQESFPSGHTAGAFLGAGFSSAIYGLSSPITAALLVLASSVGLSRYVSRKHWPSDIAAGAAIGLAHGFIAGKA